MKTYRPLGDFLTEYNMRNGNSYRPVAVGRYGIRKRESIYSKELAKDYSKNKVIFNNTLTVGMGSVQIDIGVLTEEVFYSVSPAYHTYKISGINPQYLDFCLECRNQEMFERYVKRGCRQGKTIDLQQWLKYEIPIADEKEQLEIVKKLNFVRDLVAKRRTQLAKYDDLVKSQFIEMFGNYDLGTHKYGTQRLGELSVKISDGVHSKPNYVEQGRPFISVQNINSGEVDFDNCKFVSEEAYQKMIKSTHPEKGDILYTKVGATYGIPAYVDTEIDFCLYVSVCLIKPKLELIIPRFLAASMGMQYVKQQADKRIKGIGVPDLHLNQIREFDIVVPPMEFQNEFVGFIEQIDKSKDVNEMEGAA